MILRLKISSFRLIKWRQILFMIFFNILFSQLYAQQKVVPNIRNGDITGAVNILKDSIVCVLSPNGFGKKMEVSGDKTNITALEKEHNSIWYRLESHSNCLLSFTLIPVVPNDDYDFMIFEVAKNSKDSLKVMRTNKSRRDLNKGGKTGLANLGKDAFVGEGIGNSFSTPLPIKAGKVYYLLVDNVYDNGSGHKLIFRKSGCESVNERSNFNRANYNLSMIIRDKETNKELTSDVLIIKTQYPKAPDTVFSSLCFHVFCSIDSGFYYKLEVESEGYLTYKTDFKVYPHDTLKRMEVLLQKVEIGKKITIENIYFPGGSAVILKKSMPALKELLEMMQANPNLEIEIQGHVNLPYPRAKKYKDSYYIDLSEARAKAVYDYLVKRNIEKERLSYKGFSYSQMVYPKAASEAEQQKNRRVEILILKL